MFGDVGDGAPSEGDDDAMEENAPVSSMQQQLIQKAQLHGVLMTWVLFGCASWGVMVVFGIVGWCL